MLYISCVIGCKIKEKSPKLQTPDCNFIVFYAREFLTLIFSLNFTSKKRS